MGNCVVIWILKTLSLLFLVKSLRFYGAGVWIMKAYMKRMGSYLKSGSVHKIWTWKKQTGNRHDFQMSLLHILVPTPGMECIFSSLFSFTFNWKCIFMHLSEVGFSRTARGTQFSASTLWILKVTQSGIEPSTFSHWAILSGLLYCWGRLWSSPDWTQASFVAMDSLWSSGLSILSVDWWDALSYKVNAGSYLYSNVARSKWSLLFPPSHSLVVPPSSFLLFLTRP